MTVDSGTCVAALYPTSNCAGGTEGVTISTAHSVENNCIGATMTFASWDLMEAVNDRFGTAFDNLDEIVYAKYVTDSDGTIDVLLYTDSMCKTEFASFLEMAASASDGSLNFCNPTDFNGMFFHASCVEDTIGAPAAAGTLCCRFLLQLLVEVHVLTMNQWNLIIRRLLSKIAFILITEDFGTTVVDWYIEPTCNDDAEKLATLTITGSKQTCNGATVEFTDLEGMCVFDICFPCIRVFVFPAM